MNDWQKRAKALREAVQTMSEAFEFVYAKVCSYEGGWPTSDIRTSRALFALSRNTAALLTAERDRLIVERDAAARAGMERAAGLRDAVAAAISRVDSAFGYSFDLTKLVDGVATYTLTMPNFDPVDFEDRDDAYRLIEERRNRLRADAILAAIRAALIGAGDAPASTDAEGE